MKKTDYLHRHFHYLLIFSLYLITSSITTHLYLEKFGKDISISTSQIMKFEAARPFAYRILTPSLLNWIDSHTPHNIKNKITQKSNGSPRDIRAIKQYSWHDSNVFLFILSYLFIATSLVLLQILWRHLLKRTIKLGKPSYDLAPALAILLLPMTFVKGAYIYDFPELIFATFCLIFFLEKKWIAYYITFSIACINKETSVLLGAWFLPLLLQKEFKSFAKHTAIHCILGLPILFSIRYHLSDLPGEAAQFNFYRNIEFWTSKYPWIRFEHLYAFNLPTPRTFNIINIILIVFPLSIYWRKLNAEMKRTFVASTASIFPLFLLFGLEDEVRVFMIALPSFFVLYTQALSLFYKNREAHL